MRLQDAAKHFQGNSPPRFDALLASIRRIFNFTHERANRLARYVVITRAYAKGEDVNRIAGRFGCSRTTVLRYARLAGLPTRPKHFEADVRAAVIRDYKAKVPVTVIARLHEVSTGYVSQTARKAGLSRYTTPAKKPSKKRR